MKDGKKTIYNSREARHTEEIDETVMPRGPEPIKISGVAATLFARLFKKVKQ